jgi:hypothetical protein
LQQRFKEEEEETLRMFMLEMFQPKVGQRGSKKISLNFFTVILTVCLCYCDEDCNVSGHPLALTNNRLG